MDNTSSIKIILVDDHKLFIDGLCGLLCTQPDFEVIGKASNGKEALHLINKTFPDVLIIDLNMPILDGQAASEKMISLFPSIKILVLSMYNNNSLNTSLKTLGIKGYLPKDTDTELLFCVVRDIAQGKSYFKQTESFLTFQNKFNADDDFLKKHNLTIRELEILKLICKNFSSQQIANTLFISLFTVDTHRKNMIQKLNVDKKTGLLNFALKHNLA
ncbi:response regulator [Pedobacter cryotolerans]|uniref:Response regulator transcription factor n=1 Tax=Pedobacter cryotolerans TaxID=2571270 RepID=A0A4U1C9I7_9SPHI|nr:response regulator transcription factor [Pedobacter cryotolerans]TKC03103.1 response regulator transcription factor [Pedobacter cryotolerans]